MHEPVRGMRIGRVDAGYYAELVHPLVARALDHVADVLETAGAVSQQVALDGLEHALSVWGDIAWAEFVAAYPDLDLRHVGRQIAAHYKYGANIPADKTAAARSHAYQIRDAFLAALRDVDALLLPCTPYPAPFYTDTDVDLGDGRKMNVFHGGPVWFTCPVNVAGLPALAIPAGFSADGLPVGVQLVGRPGDEWRLLRVGSAFQARTDHHRRAAARVSPGALSV